MTSAAEGEPHRLGPLNVYVPDRQSDIRQHIPKGAGIVGSPYGDTERLRIDFEGNLYQIEGLKRYADRVARAAERHTWKSHEGYGYPTSACAFVNPDIVVLVGTFDQMAGRIRLLDGEGLADWLGLDEVPDCALQVSRKDGRDSS